MWIPLAWWIPHILTKWVNFIDSSTSTVHSSPPSGQGTWSPSRFIFSIVVLFLVYIFTIMCCTSLVFGWSIILFFKTCVFTIKFGGMICPASAHSGIPILLRLCSILYIHWGQCVIQVWWYGRTKHCPIFCYVIAMNLVELKFWFVFHWWA
jgi:hypothetical protein